MHFLGNRQVNGLIIDGYTRDKATIEEMGIPQFTKEFPSRRYLETAGQRRRMSTFRFPAAARGQPGRYLLVISTALWVIPEASVDDVLLQAELNMEYEQRMEQALNSKR